MHVAEGFISRMLKRGTSANVRTVVLAVLASMLVLAVAACGSSEPDRSTDAGEIAAAVERAVSSAAETDGLTAAEVRNIVEASTASRVTAADVQKIVRYNQLFGVPPAQPGSACRQLPSAVSLDAVLSFKYIRTAADCCRCPEDIERIGRRPSDCCRRSEDRGRIRGRAADRR